MRAAAKVAHSHQMNVDGRQLRSFGSMTFATYARKSPKPSCTALNATSNTISIRKALSRVRRRVGIRRCTRFSAQGLRGTFTTEGTDSDVHFFLPAQMCLDVRRIPRPADHARVDAADAHAQF